MPSQRGVSGTITSDALTAALDKLKEDICSELKAEMRDLRAVIEKQVVEIEQLRNTIVSQAISIERLESINRQKFAIVHGIPEENGEQMLADIVKELETQIDTSFVPVRLGIKKSGKSRPLKIKFTTEKVKREAILKSRNALKKQNRVQQYLL